MFPTHFLYQKQYFLVVECENSVGGLQDLDGPDAEAAYNMTGGTLSLETLFAFGEHWTFEGWHYMKAQLHQVANACWKMLEVFDGWIWRCVPDVGGLM